MDKNRGSQFRKWDLHFHSYKTVLNNQFDNKVDYFKQLEESDIYVYGITDYFTFDNINKTINEFKKKYPKSKKVLFSNIEFRLAHNVGKSSSGHINFHLIFNPNLEPSKITAFINSLELTESNSNGTKRKITDLKTENDYSSATIELSEINNKLTSNFGNDRPYLKVFAANGLGGIRPNITEENGSKRNGVLSDEFDKEADLFFSDIQSRNYFLDKEKKRHTNSIEKACVLASDFHGDNSQRQLDKFSWIKSDLTFEGLRQVLFEPEDRISLGRNNPDEKLDYQIIDYIELDATRKIHLNSALNTVIGGRLTGKSTLTNTIAKTLRNEHFISMNNNEKRSMHVFDENINIIWRDGEEHSDLEFLPQDYMIQIAEDDEKRNTLIRNTVKSDEKNYSLIEKFEDKIRITQYMIDNLIQEWLNLKEKLSTLIKPEGDQKGINLQLQKLQLQISEQENESDVSNENLEKYKKKEVERVQYLNQQRLSEINIKYLESIKNINIKLPIILQISEDIKFNATLEKSIRIFENEINTKWVEIIGDLLKKQHEIYDENALKEVEILNSDIFKLGQSNIRNNETLKKLKEIQNKEQQKLKAFNNYEKNKKNIETQINEKQIKIIEKYKEFDIFRKELQENFKVEAMPVEIKVEFKPVKFEENIGYLHGRNVTNGTFIEEFDNNSSKKIESIFIEQNLSYNQSKNQLDLIRDILSQQWFAINYILQYDGDNFVQMSQGKKAFVILTLILEFSKDKKPVIIDQPEDSLDNRAIYNDLTNYLKKKKKERQIILVTHNPNIVVGSDAENVIVANQHSESSPNEHNYRFDYINGALENSTNQKSKFTLGKQGIREHVVEILEGGKEAFEKREKKYR